MKVWKPCFNNNCKAAYILLHVIDFYHSLRTIKESLTPVGHTCFAKDRHKRRL